MKSFEEFQKELLQNIEDEKNSSKYIEVVEEIFNKYEEEYVRIINFMKEKRRHFKDGEFYGLTTERGMLYLDYWYPSRSYISTLFKGEYYTPTKKDINKVFNKIEDIYKYNIDREYSDKKIPLKFRKYSTILQNTNPKKLIPNFIHKYCMTENVLFVLPVIYLIWISLR